MMPMFIKTETGDYINSTFVADYSIVKVREGYEVRAKMFGGEEYAVSRHETYAEASESLHTLLDSIQNAEYRSNAFERPF